MILIQNNATGGLQMVHSLDGYAEGWTVVADPVPADFASGLYLVGNGALVPDLATARARQRAVVNAGRDAAQDGGADTPSGRFDSTPRSREFLNGAITNALIAQAAGVPFTISWTLANNSVVTLTGAELITAGIAVAAHVDAMHQRARVLKERIEAAGTLAEIAAIGWTAAD